MKLWRAAAVFALALGSGVWAQVPAQAAGYAPPGSIGHDVSYPQCDKPLPAGGAFGVVGVNGGRALSANRCLAQQYAWAKALPHEAMVYLNTGNPGDQSTYWPAGGTIENGATCANAVGASDPGCAYIYGQRAAASALATAATAGVAKDTTWWLDVETANSWDGDGYANAATLQGFYDLLRDNGVEQVGIYSTGLQWSQITGGYNASSANVYKFDWGLAVPAKYPMEDGPLWIAGVTATKAASNCLTTFTGGPAVLAQYIAEIDGRSFDHNLVCGTRSTTPSVKDACDDGAGLPPGYLAVYGTDRDDSLKGTSADEVFYAGKGDDKVRAGKGEDILCGGSGRDDLDGGPGNDRLEGGSGKDELSGDDGRDTLLGGTGADRLSGEKGRDVLKGGGGDDRLAGGGSADELFGQAGRDTLNGGSGKDDCSGGSGKDPRPVRC